MFYPGIIRNKKKGIKTVVIECIYINSFKPAVTLEEESPLFVLLKAIKGKIQSLPNCYNSEQL